MSYQFHPKTFITLFDEEIKKRKEQIDEAKSKLAEITAPERVKKIQDELAKVQAETFVMPPQYPRESYWKSGYHPKEIFQRQKNARIMSLASQIQNESKPFDEQIAKLQKEIEEIEKQKHPFVLDLEHLQTKTSSDGFQTIVLERASDFNPFSESKRESNSLFGIIAVIVVIATIIFLAKVRK